MNRKTFLTSLSSATLVALVPKPMIALAPAKALDFVSTASLLQPSYRAWLDALDLEHIFYVVAVEDPNQDVTTVIRRASLSKDRNQRLDQLLELQERHPWTAEDWNVAHSSALEAKDQVELVRLEKIRSSRIFAPLVLSPESYRSPLNEIE